MGAAASIAKRHAATQLSSNAASMASGVRGTFKKREKYDPSQDPWFACEAGDLELIASLIDKVE